jgi:hypothetical protein
MTTASDIRLRKTETRNKPGCVATYAAVADGKTVGYIDKYVHAEVTHEAARGSGGRTRTAKFTTWGYRRPGTLEVPPGCNRRRDAVDWLARSL